MTHTGSKRLKPAENRFTQSDFTSFFLQGSANSYNFRFRQYSKVVKSLWYDPTISQVFQSNSWRVFLFDPTVWRAMVAWRGNFPAAFSQINFAPCTTFIVGATI